MSGWSKSPARRQLTARAARRRTAFAIGGLVLGSGVLSLGPGTSAADAACDPTAHVDGDNLPRFFPRLTSGDREFAGHGPAITISAKMRRVPKATRDTLVVVVKMRAEETQPDTTTADSGRTFPLYQAPRGCRIRPGSVRVGSFDSNGYLAAPAAADPFPLDAGDTNASFVQGYRVWDDRVGLDVGLYTSVQVVTRAFNIRLSE
jgi:hypothetical protein